MPYANHRIKPWLFLTAWGGCFLLCLFGCNNDTATEQSLSEGAEIPHAASVQEKKPEISIEGIVYDQNNPLVIINGQILSERDTIAGLKVVDISSTGITLEDMTTHTRITEQFQQPALASSGSNAQRPALSSQAKKSFSFSSAQTIETSDVLIYLPSNITQFEKYPLLIVLSTDGDAQAALDYIQPICEKYKWVAFGSKKFSAGIDLRPVIGELASAVKALSKTYPIDTKRVVIAGFSAGAMGAHFFSWAHPDITAAIIVNTGMIHESFRDGRRQYPSKKYAVFLASPTDFRYQQMQDDRHFLMQRGWNVKWVEFKGGHTLAPLSVYEEALRWLKVKLGQ